MISCLRLCRAYLSTSPAPHTQFDSQRQRHGSAPCLFRRRSSVRLYVYNKPHVPTIHIDVYVKRVSLCVCVFVTLCELCAGAPCSSRPHGPSVLSGAKRIEYDVTTKPAAAGGNQAIAPSVPCRVYKRAAALFPNVCICACVSLCLRQPTNRQPSGQPNTAFRPRFEVCVR